MYAGRSRSPSPSPTRSVDFWGHGRVTFVAVGFDTPLIYWQHAADHVLGCQSYTHILFASQNGTAQSLLLGANCPMRFSSEPRRV
jgi:hypothetical protein